MSTNPKKRKFAGGSNVGGGESGERPAAEHETPLDAIATGWQLNAGPPSYTHCVLPFIYEREHTWSYDSDEIFAYDRGFRMTSVYDPIIGTAAAVDLNAGVGRANWHPIQSEGADALSASSRAVAYYDYYKSLYKYYNVLGCRYKIRIENLSHEKFYVHQMFVNAELPPGEASNWDMLLWPECKSRLLHPVAVSGDTTQQNRQEMVDEGWDGQADMVVDPTTNMSGANAYVIQNPVGSSFTYFVGEYRPGDHDHNIVQDNDAATWTAVTANPTLREALLLRIRPYENGTPPIAGDANQYERRISFNITVELNYLVEFKELDIKARYPTTRNPMQISYNLNPLS